MVLFNYCNLLKNCDFFKERCQTLSIFGWEMEGQSLHVSDLISFFYLIHAHLVVHHIQTVKAIAFAEWWCFVWFLVYFAVHFAIFSAQRPLWEPILCDSWEKNLHTDSSNRSGVCLLWWVLRSLSIFIVYFIIGDFKSLTGFYNISKIFYIAHGWLASGLTDWLTDGPAGWATNGLIF